MTLARCLFVTWVKRLNPLVLYSWCDMRGFLFVFFFYSHSCFLFVCRCYHLPSLLHFPHSCTALPNVSPPPRNARLLPYPFHPNPLKQYQPGPNNSIMLLILFPSPHPGPPKKYLSKPSNLIMVLLLLLLSNSSRSSNFISVLFL